MGGAPAPSPNPSQPPGTGSDGPIFQGPGLSTYLTYLAAIYGVLEIAGILPNPISVLIGLFSGRPREQATVQIANRLLGAKNLAAKILGIEWLKAVHDLDVTISQSGSGVAIVDALDSQFVNNLVAQGVTLGRARNILVNAYSRAAQDGAPLEPELKEGLADGLTVFGPQSFDDLANYWTHYGEVDGYSGDKLSQFVLRQIFIAQPVAQLDQLYIAPIPSTDPTPTQPPGTTVPPGLGNQPTPTQPPGNDDGDELTECCQASAAALTAIATAVQSLTGGLGTGTDDACCTNVVAAINGVASALGAIAPAPPGAPAAPVDLSGVIAELTAIATNIGEVGPGPVDLTPVVDAINNLATALGNPNADLERIANDLDSIAADTDPDGDAFVNLMVSRGVLDAQVAAIIIGQT